MPQRQHSVDPHVARGAHAHAPDGAAKGDEHHVQADAPPTNHGLCRAHPACAAEGAQRQSTRPGAGACSLASVT